MSERNQFNFHFDNCVFFDAEPGHALLDVGVFPSLPGTMAVALSKSKTYNEPRTKLKHIKPVSDEDKELYPSVCILLYSPEQAMAYADVFAGVAEDLKKLKENKED